MCESPEERKTRQTKQQFEELGRFIQAFEMMVFQVRFACAQILPRTVWQQRLLNLILYHEALTARVSFDIMRAMYGEIINDPDSGFSDEERGVVDGVLLQLAKEYELLAKSRNHLLHATWHVGASDIEEGALQSTNSPRGKKVLLRKICPLPLMSFVPSERAAPRQTN